MSSSDIWWDYTLEFAGFFGRAVRHVFSRSLLYTLSAVALESRELATTGNIIVHL